MPLVFFFPLTRHTVCEKRKHIEDSCATLFHRRRTVYTSREKVNYLLNSFLQAQTRFKQLGLV